MDSFYKVHQNWLVTEMIENITNLNDQFMKKKGVKYEVYLQQWLNANTTEYPGAGTFPTVYQNLMYDATWTLAHAIHNLYDLGIYAPNASDITNIIPNTTFIGISGSVEFDSNGDRIGFYNLFNLLGKGSFQRFGTWDVVIGLNVSSTPIFHSGDSGYPGKLLDS